MINKKSCLTIVISISLIGMLLLYVFLPQREMSEMENRRLTMRPALSFSSLLDGSFMEQFDTYTAEQIPFRDGFIKLKNTVSGILLMRENNNVVLGRSGHLFEKTIGVDKQLYKNEAMIEKFFEMLDEAGYEGTKYVMIAPTASNMLKDLVPDGMPDIDQESLVLEFYEELNNSDAKNVVPINIFDDLMENRESSRELYYRTDHHWTSYGAYLAYKKLCKQIGEDPVEITMLSKNEVTDFYGTLYAKNKTAGSIADVIDYYDIPIKSFTVLQSGPGGVTDGENLKEGYTTDSLYDLSKTQVYDKYAMFLHGNNGLVRIETGRDISDTDKEQKKVIVIKDSYANCFVPFFTYQVDIIDVIDLRYFRGNMMEYFEENKEADVLFLYNFSNFMTDNHFYKLMQ